MTPLPGGLTNTNYRVRTDAGLDVVVRVSAPETGLLGVDRHAEHVNTLAAAAAGVGAPVVDYLEGRGVMVVGFLPGRTWADADVAANLARLAAALHRLHAGPAFVGRFDMFALRRQYLGIVREHGFRMPSDATPRSSRSPSRVERVLALAPEPLVPVPQRPARRERARRRRRPADHRLRVLGHERAVVRARRRDRRGAAWGRTPSPSCATAYYGRHDDALVARAELWGWMARYGWTLWGMIQDGTSAHRVRLLGVVDGQARARPSSWPAGPRFDELLARAAAR